MSRKYALASDANQQEIIDGLRQLPGCSVRSIHRVGKGLPDLLVGWRGKNYLMEVKTDKGKLTEAEQEFIFNWTGQVTIVRNLEDALGAIGVC